MNPTYVLPTRCRWTSYGTRREPDGYLLSTSTTSKTSSRYHMLLCPALLWENKKLILKYINANTKSSQVPADPSREKIPTPQEDEVLRRSSSRPTRMNQVSAADMHDDQPSSPPRQESSTPSYKTQTYFLMLHDAEAVNITILYADGRAINTLAQVISCLPLPKCLLHNHKSFRLCS